MISVLLITNTVSYLWWSTMFLSKTNNILPWYIEVKTSWSILFILLLTLYTVRNSVIHNRIGWHQSLSSGICWSWKLSHYLPKDSSGRDGRGRNKALLYDSLVVYEIKSFFETKNHWKFEASMFLQYIGRFTVSLTLSRGDVAAGREGGN